MSGRWASLREAVEMLGGSYQHLARRVPVPGAAGETCLRWQLVPDLNACAAPHPLYPGRYRFRRDLLAKVEKGERIAERAS